MSSQESHIYFNKYADVLQILMGKEFTEEVIIFSSKV